MGRKYGTTAEGLDAAQIDRARRHLFLCLGPDCTDPRDGEQTWEHLKRQCRELDLPVMRTKASCFRVCVGGPWLLVYPEGVWYGGVTPQRCDRILREHILENKPVEEWAARLHPLCGGSGK
jgi:(2Fe-2S) ferredoxin